MPKIIRTNRKSIAIIVEKDGSLTVRAPKKLPDSMISHFINEHTDWIQKTRTKIRQQQPPVHRFYEGELFYYLGSAYPLKYGEDQKSALIFNNGFFLDRKYRDKPDLLFQKWFKQEARRVITKRVTKISSALGYRFAKMRITSAKTRWGSCSSRKTLSFSYRLVMAPEEVIDSVIVHELVHLEIPNHSPAFYKRLERHLPDYRKYRKWLKENGIQLSLE